MKITFLGTGTSQGIPVIGSKHPVCLSPDPRDQRLRVSVMVETDDGRVYVIDCGPDFRQLQPLRHAGIAGRQRGRCGGRGAQYRGAGPEGAAATERPHGSARPGRGGQRAPAKFLAPQLLETDGGSLQAERRVRQQGQEYGYLERDSAGGSSVSFKDVDLLLEVTPHVTPDNRISMTILITKNDVVDFVEDVPVISTNEAQTELLVNDGDTIVIGGIMKSSNSKTKSAFPGLHKVPILG